MKKYYSIELNLCYCCIFAIVYHSYIYLRFLYYEHILFFRKKVRTLFMTNDTPSQDHVLNDYLLHYNRCVAILAASGGHYYSIIPIKYCILNNISVVGHNIMGYRTVTIL